MIAEEKYLVFVDETAIQIRAIIAKGNSNYVERGFALAVAWACSGSSGQWCLG